MGERGQAFYQAVREDVLALLCESGLSDDFSQAIHLALMRDGKILSAEVRSKWPLLSLLSCWGAGGEYRDALPAATAAELVGASSDIFDEIEDGDECPTSAALGEPRAINLASALLALAGLSLSRVPTAISRPLWSAVVLAADGQHQDLGARAFSTPEEYLALVDRKSAGLISAFCAAGAGLSGAAASKVSRFAEFGLHLGRLAQLANDLHGVWPEGRGRRDLERRLVTLPIIFVLRGPDNPARELLRRHLASSEPLLESEEKALRTALQTSGALHYTWLMAETSRSAASAVLDEVCPASADTVRELLLPPLREPSPRAADQP